MMSEHQNIGATAITTLDRMPAWEARLIVNLRLWLDGPGGRNDVRQNYTHALSPKEAEFAFDDFQHLLTKLVRTAHRPVVRRCVDCACVGSDECVFVHLIRTASDGHLNDAALIATLLSGPSHAEHIAILAGQVGETMRRVHRTHGSPHAPQNLPRVMRVH